MDIQRALGFKLDPQDPFSDPEKVSQYIYMKLAAMGFPIEGRHIDADFLQIIQPLFKTRREKSRLLSQQLCPSDRRVQEFLDDYLKDVTKAPQLPSETFILDRHGLARSMSLSPTKDSFTSPLVNSYRVKQGILHNPHSDRRTTQGVFHICEGGLPIPDDKIAVPRVVFAKILAEALKPPPEILQLPFGSHLQKTPELFVSLLLRPLVCPQVPGFIAERTMEVRFLAPGILVSNLDFVESIFGNAGDPYLPENDAGLDVEHWTGHTGYVILAPHLVKLKKKDLGLPPHSKASEMQKRDGMCWKDENELYNDGKAFKITCRDERGIMVTVIADNYFGYCKKEVKTQISFSANLFGLCEEEHSGGAVAFPSYDLGEEFHLQGRLPRNNMTFKDVLAKYAGMMIIKPEGYGVDKRYRDIFYVPEDAVFNLSKQSVSWMNTGKRKRIKLLAYHTYVLPSGYKIHMEKQAGGPNWRLIGTVAQGTLCHKPCTVSGGGKSEISKSLDDAMIQGPIFTSDFHKDFDKIETILKRDFSDRFRRRFKETRPSRHILSPDRSLGSVIKLFTPSYEYNDKYNAWLESLPHDIKEMIYVVKRYYRPEWGDGWRKYFSVDVINGTFGHELKYGDKKLVAHYLRVGHEKDGSWRTYKVRQDFRSAEKLQMEDDITASVVVPKEIMHPFNPVAHHQSIKVVQNCEYRLFQRPDDVIHRGYDKQAESDLAGPHAFLSNFEPYNLKKAGELMQDAIGFDLYTAPMKRLLRKFLKDKKPLYVVSSAHPRLVDGKASKNPRYLQNRPDLVNPRSKYLAQAGTRLFWKIPLEKPIYFPVDAVLPGRRNNPPDPKAGILPLAVYNPIHYQELPELFMDFICSLTGKSPSTTGFGSEGALTKGPFNALSPVTDLNNALVSYIVTGYQGFTSAAGFVGPYVRVDHDISLLMPEVWSRMVVYEQDPKFLIRSGYLEPLKDFEYKGRRILASRLGFRITLRFVHAFFGRIFSNPNAVCTEDMLKPELQNQDMFCDGVENIVATQKKVAQNYFNDGSIENACPPLQALLHIMVSGSFEGKDINHPDIRSIFTREALLKSAWYKERLCTKQSRDIDLWQRHVKTLEAFIAKDRDTAKDMDLEKRLSLAKKRLENAKTPSYVTSLQGSLGADPLGKSVGQNPSGKSTSLASRKKS